VYERAEVKPLSCTPWIFWTTSLAAHPACPCSPKRAQPHGAPRAGIAIAALVVEGEVSNFMRAASGHWYFSLKDANAQVRCVMFPAATSSPISPRPTATMSKSAPALAVRSTRRIPAGRRSDPPRRCRTPVRSLPQAEGQARSRGPVRPPKKNAPCPAFRAASASHLAAGRRPARRADGTGAPHAGVAGDPLPDPVQGAAPARRSPPPSAPPARAPSATCCWCAAAAVRWRICGRSMTKPWCVRLPPARCRW